MKRASATDMREETENKAPDFPPFDLPSSDDLPSLPDASDLPEWETELEQWDM